MGWRPSKGDEVEWDETERNWMRSLAEYERSLCPMCGLPRSICQDPKANYIACRNQRLLGHCAHAAGHETVD
ncbi:MAG: hypothetical protein ACLSUZ_03360 [Bifidobacterium pseudocatenulatum]